MLEKGYIIEGVSSFNSNLGLCSVFHFCFFQDTLIFHTGFSWILTQDGIERQFSSLNHK